MLFGSELFESLVGEFAMAAAAKAGGDISEAELKHAQEVSRGLGLWKAGGAAVVVVWCGKYRQGGVLG
jgi:hypothetical protein